MIESNYKVINDQWIELTSGEYQGTLYKYGRVELIDEGNTLRIKFEYELPGKKKISPEHEKSFTNVIGPILGDLIDKGIMNNSIVYTGGIDEN